MAIPPFAVRPPSGPFAAQANLPNIHKYENAAARGQSISSQDVDADINNCIDFINSLYQNLQNATAGVIPGANLDGNVGKFPKTDGNSNIDWVKVNTDYIAQNGIDITRLQQAAQGSMISFNQNQQPFLISPGAPGDILQMIGVVGNTYPSFVAGGGFLRLAGGTMNSEGFLGLPSAFSSGINTSNQFKNGTGNGAAYDLYNVALKMTYGLGFVSDTEENTGYVDFILGKMSLKTGYWMKNNDGDDTEGAVLPATAAEMQTATAINRAVTPQNINSSPYAAAGYVLFGVNNLSGVLTVLNSKGGSWNVTRLSNGRYTVTMPWTFSSVNNYLIEATAEAYGTAQGISGAAVSSCSAQNKGVSSFDICCANPISDSLTDAQSFSVVVFAASNP